MKKSVYFFLIFLLFSFNSIDLVISTFCCQTAPKSNQWQCYTYGECCKIGTEDEYWDETGCFDFNLWVEPKSMMFTIGRKTQINLYLENLGSFTDSYDIDYEIIVGNQALIKVDMSGVSPTASIAPGEVKKLYPRVTILSTEASGKIKFTATSHGKPDLEKSAILNVKQGDFPLSLIEFNIFSLLVLMILVAIIYFYFKSKH